jgi:hypothetical protein
MTQQERESILEKMNNAKNFEKKSEAKPSEVEAKLAEVKTKGVKKESP